MMSSICSGEVVSEGKHFVELIEGHEAALLGLLDHLLDGGIRQIEQRRRRVRRILLGGVRCLVVFFLVFNLQRLCLGGHSSSSRNALMRGGVNRNPRGSLSVTYDAERAAQTVATPNSRLAGVCTNNGAAIKFRLTLFLQPNHGFGESFNGFGQNRPHHFFIRRCAGTGPKARQNPRSGPRCRRGNPAGRSRPSAMPNWPRWAPRPRPARRPSFP